MAQEVKEAADECGASDLNIYNTDNVDRMAINTGNMIPAMVNAIKELAAKNAALEARLR